jgi:hypothetical protein
MRLKIKWNDDRVRGATTAILLITRDRLLRGETLADMIRDSLVEYRADPEGYKERKRDWADARETGPLTKPLHLAYYGNLQASIAQLMQRMADGKRQFNSLLELDNYLIASLEKVR